MGFILCSIISYNLEIFLFYITVYSFILINIFIILFNFINPVSKKSINNINQLIYLKKMNYIYFLSLIISFFSISGIPPLSGFFSKFVIFVGLVNLNMNLSTLFLLLSGVLSCFYYLRIIKIISFNNSQN